MNKNGLKLLNKTAFNVVGWMIAIVAVVAWRSDGNTLAVSLAAGLPIGVLAFWVIMNVREASQMDPRVADRVAAEFALHHPAKAAKIAAKKAEAAEKLQVKKPTKTVQIARAEPRQPMAEVTRLNPSPKPTHIPMPPIPVHNAEAYEASRSKVPAKPTMLEAAAALENPKVFDLENFDNSGRFDFLDQMNYLYTPTARGRQTLDLFGSGKILTAEEQALLEMENGDVLERPVPVFDVDLEDK